MQSGRNMLLTGISTRSTLCWNAVNNGPIVQLGTRMHINESVVSHNLLVLLELHRKIKRMLHWSLLLLAVSGLVPGNTGSSNTLSKRNSGNAVHAKSEQITIRHGCSDPIKFRPKRRIEENIHAKKSMDVLNLNYDYFENDDDELLTIETKKCSVVMKIENNTIPPYLLTKFEKLKNRDFTELSDVLCELGELMLKVIDGSLSLAKLFCTADVNTSNDLFVNATIHLYFDMRVVSKYDLNVREIEFLPNLVAELNKLVKYKGTLEKTPQVFSIFGEKYTDINLFLLYATINSSFWSNVTRIEFQDEQAAGYLERSLLVQHEIKEILFHSHLPEPVLQVKLNRFITGISGQITAIFLVYIERSDVHKLNSADLQHYIHKGHLSKGAMDFRFIGVDAPPIHAQLRPQFWQFNVNANVTKRYNGNDEFEEIKRHLVMETQSLLKSALARCEFRRLFKRLHLDSMQNFRIINGNIAFTALIKIAFDAQTFIRLHPTQNSIILKILDCFLSGIRTEISSNIVSSIEVKNADIRSNPMLPKSFQLRSN